MGGEVRGRDTGRVFTVPVDHSKASGCYSKYNGMPLEGFDQRYDRI